MDVADIYRLTREFPQAFAECDTLAAFAERHPREGMREVLRRYAEGWAGRYYLTCKAHPDTFLARPLFMPNARTFADLFHEARLYGQRIISAREGSVSEAPYGFYFIGGSAAPGYHLGGHLTIRIMSSGTPVRQRSGCAYKSTYVRPRAETLAAAAEYFGPLIGCPAQSFEAIKREDGILITARDSTYIGSAWVALLDPSESIRSIMPDDVRAEVEAEESRSREAFAGLSVGPDGREVLDESKVPAFVTVKREG